MGAPESPQFHQQLTVALDDERQKHLAAAVAIVTEATDLVIDCGPMAVHANTMLQDLKKRKSRIEAMHDDIVGPIKLALANAKKWFTPAINAHDEAEAIIKAKLRDWTQKENERVAREARERQEAERRARQEAEQQAAAARARAAEAARKAAAEAAAAEAERRRQEEAARQAREAGDRRAAAAAEARAQAAAAERAKREEEEQQRIANAEREAQRIELEARAKAEATAAEAKAAVAEPAKLDGLTMRDNWVARLADDTTEDQAKIALAKAIAGGRTDLLGLLKLDLSAAGKLAKAQKQHFNAPGLKAVNDKVVASRRAA